MNYMMQDMIDWIEDHLLDKFSLKSLGLAMAIRPIIVLLSFIK